MKSDLAEKLKNLLDNMSQEQFDASWSEITALNLKGPLMSDYIEDLKKYFETTPREKVLENWAKSESFDDIGPTMDEFLEIANNNPRLRWDVRLILDNGYDLIGVSEQMCYEVYVFSNIADAIRSQFQLEHTENKICGFFYDIPGWEKSCVWYKEEFGIECKLIKILK